MIIIKDIVMWAGGLLATCALLLILWHVMLNMPGKSVSTFKLPNTSEHLAIKAALKKHVEVLARDIGERNVEHDEALNRAKAYISQVLKDEGYELQVHAYEFQQNTYANLIASKKGTLKPEEVLIIGAHYDSVQTSPGANDNASGVAAVLVLAKLLKDVPLDRSLQFVFFTNEEPPRFKTKHMGSFQYAKYLKKEGTDVKIMISVETIGYYSDSPNSQRYPFPFGLLYPNQGNFIGFVSNVSSRKALKKALGIFREKAQILPSEGGAIFSWVPGVDWSDQWSFWKMGYPAIMITDTAFFRYPYYHTSEDTPDKLDYDRMSAVVEGLKWVLLEYMP